MNQVRLRAATDRDEAAVAEIVHGSPGPESVGLLGGEEAARRIGFAMARLQARGGRLGRTVLAEIGDRPVGVLQWRVGGGRGPSVPWELARATLHALGLRGALRAGLRERVRRRVNPTPPPGAFHVEELHVLAGLRGRGIGGRLLDHAEAQARRGGFPSLSLVTHTRNPAQSLYRRAGFEETARLEDPDYERLTGIPGRILMVKRLDR